LRGRTGCVPVESSPLTATKSSKTNQMASFESLLLASALFLCTDFSSAQEGGPPHVRRVTGPLRPARLDLDTGTLTRGRHVSEKGAPGFSTCSTLGNLDHSGFAGVGSGLGAPFGPCEWIDAADKGLGSSGGKSGIMSGFAFAYCSAALDTRSGGPGGYTRIGFRSGYAKGIAANAPAVSGTDVGTFVMTGLPAWTGCSSFFGGFACYLINVGFGPNPLVLPDGPIGWSWRFTDLGTNGILAKTFPFVSCVQSCAGFGPDSTGGMTDCIDQYCPAGSILNSFTFGTSSTGSYYTSISMDIREVVPIAATCASTCLANSQTLTCIAPPVWSAGTQSFNFNVALNCAGVAGPAPAILVASLLSAPCTPTQWGQLACNVQAANLLAKVTIPNHGGGNVPINTTAMNIDLSLLGACWCLQGFCGNNGTGPGRLSNGLIQELGTF